MDHHHVHREREHVHSIRSVRPPHSGTVNRSPASRLTALLAAVLFFLAWGGEAVGVHACPHHAGIHPVPGAHAEMDHSGGDHHKPDAPQHGECTCVSGCPSVAGSLLPVDIDAVGIQVAVALIGPRPFPPTESSTQLVLPYVLPYAHAPPLG